MMEKTIKNNCVAHSSHIDKCISLSSGISTIFIYLKKKKQKQTKASYHAKVTSGMECAF